jgi:hypothetical protein
VGDVWAELLDRRVFGGSSEVLHDLWSMIMSDGVRSCMQKVIRRRDMSERVDVCELATTSEHVFVTVL